MRYTLLTFVLVCIILTPFAAQAEKKPIIYYSFDGVKENTVKDRSGSGNDGELIDNPKVVGGKVIKGLEFADNYVSIPPSDSLSANFFQEGLFTLVLWMNRQSEGKKWQAIFTSESPVNTRDTLFLNQDGRLSWRGLIGGNYGTMCETTPGVVAVGEWTHVALVSDQNNFRLYINGTLKKEAAFQKTDGGNTIYYIGEAPYQFDHIYAYGGIIDDFAIFAEPLNEDEIMLVMDLGVADFAAVEPGGKLVTQWAALRSIWSLP